MAMKITKLQYTIYSKKLKEITLRLPELESNLQSARALGDLSENAEYDSARQDLTSMYIEKTKYEGLLQSEVIDYDNTSVITVGSIIKISSPCLGKDSVVMLGDSGDFVIEPVLNTKSALGLKVLGNMSGEYTIKDNIFYVEKIRNPDMEKFAELYLDEETAIKQMLEEEEV